MHRARPPLNFIPEKFNPLVLGIASLSLPILLRYRLRPWLPAGIARVETENVEVLVDLYRRFQLGKIRFLVAFRHPEVDDPLSMFYLLSRAVPRVARQSGIPLQLPIHSHFLYDRGMTIWAGNWLGWLFSRLGGSPIHRGKKLDWQGMRAARSLFFNGRFPLTVAPEGATNGHSEIVSPLEPGVAQLGFWCVEDVQKAQRYEEVYVVPVGIRYRYLEPPWEKLDGLLGRLEADVGLPVRRVGPVEETERESRFYERLLHLGEHLLLQMEQFYTRFYLRSLSTDPDRSLIERLQALLDASLQVSEDYLGLPGRGTIVERCRWVENAGWNRIYREDLPDFKTLSPLDRGLADWTAVETELRMRHMRLVESFVAVTESYVKEKPTVERFAETALILFDAIARLKGEKNPRRPRLGWRVSTVTVGEPIALSDRWPTYEQNRRAARGAIADLTQDLQMALEKLTR